MKEIIRQNNTQFQECLNEIRLGKCSLKNQKLLESRIGVKLETINGIKPTILYSKNKAVNKYNLKKLNMLIKNIGKKTK